jgi:hypothetical protein
MSAIQSKQETCSSDRGETHASWAATIMRKSAGATLIELGITLAAAESSAPILGRCSHCQNWRDLRTSTARFPNVFCSEQCERDFVRGALASLTVKDCIRMHGRLEALLRHAQESAI